MKIHAFRLTKGMDLKKEDDTNNRLTNIIHDITTNSFLN